MLRKPDACRGCPLQILGSGFASLDGDGKSTGILVVAEALGGNEAATGKPLVGPAGKVWDRIVSRVRSPYLGRDLQRGDFLLSNCIWCQPPGNVLAGAPYESAALDHCRPNLEGVLTSFKPRCIIALGNTALRWFTGNSGIDSLRGYVFETPWGLVVPTYHPSYIMRGKWNLARVVELDILKALQVAAEGVGVLHVDKAYELQPTFREAEEFFMEWRAAGRPPIAFDIETPKADEAVEHEDMVFEDDASYQILMCSFAWKPFHAISLPWIEPFKTLARQAFAEPADFLVWNAKFDVPRLSADGVHFGGRIVDAMLAWHWLEPALPMGLKYVATFFCPDMGAWKLEMHKNFQWYNAADSDVLLRVFLEVRKRLEDQGRWPIFERHFLDFGKILQKISERGITVDHEARKAARDRFEIRFRETVDRARELAPTEVCALHPKQGYKRTPSDTTGMVRIEVELTPKEVEQREKERTRAIEKVKKQREKLQRKAAREAARRERAAAKDAREAERRARREARAHKLTHKRPRRSDPKA